MKVIILAGGLGTRLSEETKKIPKPMVRINGIPIICHIIRHYIHYNFKDFIILSGYKHEIIKKFFANYKILGVKIKVVNTGIKSNTGERIKKVKKLIDTNDFLLTYGDGISNLDISKQVKYFYKKRNTIDILMTIVRPQARFGKVKIINNRVEKFEEKNQLNEGWINGGFFVCNKSIFKYFGNKINPVFEKDILPKTAKKKKFYAFKHESFWYCMDTLRDKINLDKIMKKKKFTWKIN